MNPIHLDSLIKVNRAMKNNMSIFFLFNFLLLSGCQETKPHRPVEESSTRIEQSLKSSRHIYLARLKLINNLESVIFRGGVTFTISQEKIQIHSHVSGSKPNFPHWQSIHSASRCPDLGDDLNSDGKINEKETHAIIGDALVPLDDDLSTQWRGYGQNPYSNSLGNYDWYRATESQNFLDDLFDRDINKTDGLKKLDPHIQFTPEGLIVILGVQTSLREFILLACGRLEKISTPPGKKMNDEGISLDYWNESIPFGTGEDDGVDLNQPNQDFPGYGNQHPND
jgi:hypothetical protein